MSRNLTDYAITPSLASGMLQNFTDYALTRPFNSWHAAEFPGLPNDGCQVPQSGQAWVAPQQTDDPWTKLGNDTKEFTQKDDIDYKETFSSVSRNDSFITIMALVAHYDLELHHVDVKTAFLNGELEGNVYMDQPMRFSVEGNEHMVCKLKKSIYSLK